MLISLLHYLLQFVYILYSYRYCCNWCCNHYVMDFCHAKLLLRNTKLYLHWLSFLNMCNCASLSSWITRTYSSYILGMTADDLVMQGVRASAAMVMSRFPRIFWLQHWMDLLYFPPSSLSSSMVLWRLLGLYRIFQGLTQVPVWHQQGLLCMVMNN